LRISKITTYFILLEKFAEENFAMKLRFDGGLRISFSAYRSKALEVAVAIATTI